MRRRERRGAFLRTASSYQKAMNVGASRYRSAIGRASLRCPDHLPSWGPVGPFSSYLKHAFTWPVSLPYPRVLHRHLRRPTIGLVHLIFGAIQPSPPVLRPATLLRGTSRGQVSMEFSLADALFAPDVLSGRRLRESSFPLGRCEP